MSKNFTAKDEHPQKHTLTPADELTTNQGLKIIDDQNSLKAGVRGPTSLEDFHFG